MGDKLVVIASLQLRYYDVVSEYMELFIEKQDMDFDFWVGDIVGGIASMGDHFFSFDDIRLDIDGIIPKGVILDWYDYTVYNNENGAKDMNYITYLKLNGFFKK